MNSSIFAVNLFLKSSWVVITWQLFTVHLGGWIAQLILLPKFVEKLQINRMQPFFIGGVIIIFLLNEV